MSKFLNYRLLALIYIPIILIFESLEVHLTPVYNMYFFIDSYIPFVPWFVIFYVVWFAYMFLATAYFMVVSKEDFLKITAFLSIGMILSLIIFIIFPNEQSLRPQTLGSDIFSKIIAMLYEIDTPTNVCPSIHVLNSLAVHICISKSEKFSNNRIVKTLSFFIMVMINLSTMFIKQHSIIDVFFGALLSGVVYMIVYGLMFKPENNKGLINEA